MSHWLIQRLVTSNPSPRYLAEAASAFKSGAYGGRVFSGQHGDLAATVSAILLDKEARSLVLDADPMHGQIREPLVKLYHFLRAMEYWPRYGAEVDLKSDLNDVIGQRVFSSPSVFNFFTADYSPEGSVQDAGLVAPEGQLQTLPYVLGFVDGISSLVFDGLTENMGGFGAMRARSYDTAAYPAPWSNYGNDGYLAFSPSNASTADSVIDELDLLLTAGNACESQTLLHTTT